jgi:mono/diheme cytochrome c family protein
MVLRRAEHGLSLLLGGADRRGVIAQLGLRCALACALAGAAPALAQDDGQGLFAEVCAACHQGDGRGVPGVYPPLADSIGRFVSVPEGRAYLARVLVYGMFGPIRVEERPYNGLMPPPAFEDAEIAEVLNYTLTELSGEQLPRDFAPFTAEEVAGHHEPIATPSEMRKEREALLEKLRKQSGALPEIPRITGVAQDFARQCQGCHGADGMGARDAIPRLREFVGYFTQLPGGRDYLMRVPGVVFAPLDNQRLAAVLNWTLATFSPAEMAPDFAPFTAAEINRHRKNPIVEVRATRDGLLAQLRAAGLLVGDDDGLISAAVAGPP